MTNQPTPQPTPDGNDTGLDPNAFPVPRDAAPADPQRALVMLVGQAGGGAAAVHEMPEFENLHIVGIAEPGDPCRCEGTTPGTRAASVATTTRNVLQYAGLLADISAITVAPVGPQEYFDVAATVEALRTEFAGRGINIDLLAPSASAPELAVTVETLYDLRRQPRQPEPGVPSDDSRLPERARAILDRLFGEGGPLDPVGRERPFAARHPVPRGYVYVGEGLTVRIDVIQAVGEGPDGTAEVWIESDDPHQPTQRTIGAEDLAAFRRTFFREH